MRIVCNKIISEHGLDENLALSGDLKFEDMDMFDVKEIFNEHIEQPILPSGLDVDEDLALIGCEKKELHIPDQPIVQEAPSAPVVDDIFIATSDTNNGVSHPAVPSEQKAPQRPVRPTAFRQGVVRSMRAVGRGIRKYPGRIFLAVVIALGGALFERGVFMPVGKWAKAKYEDVMKGYEQWQVERKKSAALEEQKRLAEEERERVAFQKLQEQNKLEKERMEKEEKERKLAEKERQERLEKEDKVRQEQERIADEKKQKERERIARETKEREKADEARKIKEAKEKAERMAKDKADKAAKDKAERMTKAKEDEAKRNKALRERAGRDEKDKRAADKRLETSAVQKDMHGRDESSRRSGEVESIYSTIDSYCSRIRASKGVDAQFEAIQIRNESKDIVDRFRAKKLSEADALQMMRGKKSAIQALLNQ